MATDKSEPRVGLILKVGVLAIMTLVIVRAALVSYFDRVAHAEEHRKLGEAKPEALMSLREDEKERLASGPLPIDKAMQRIAARGRSVSPDISPTASKDLGPLQGWQKMPARVPSEMTAEPVAPRAETPGDAGAPPGAADGASLRAKPDRAHADGGAPARVPTKPIPKP